jgi:opacity protein-like surface antigen
MRQTAIAAILLMLAGASNAADDVTQWRIGGSVDYSDYERDDGQIKDSGTGFKFFAQYRFNSWFGAEGAFYVSPDFSGDVTPLSGGGETDTSYQGLTLHGVGYVPFPGDRFDVFLKAGYYNFFDVKLQIDGQTTDTSSEDGLALGIGSSVQATDKVGVRVEVDWYDVGGAELWTVGLGLEYRF